MAVSSPLDPVPSPSLPAATTMPPATTDGHMASSASVAEPTDHLTAQHVVDQVHMMQSLEGGGNPPLLADHKNIVAMDAFIMDSGASVHATGDRRIFSHLSVIVQPAESSTAASSRSRAHVRVANGAELPIHGYGTVRRDHITLHGVLFVPGLSKNIVSVPKLAERGYTVEFTRTRCFIRDAYGATVGKARLVNGLYELDFLQDPHAR